MQKANIFNVSREIYRRFRLSKLFFYALVLLLPFGTRKIFLTENSYYFGYFSFYNTLFLYLTDLLFFGLILAWLCETGVFSRFWPFSRLNANSLSRQQGHAKNANDTNNANISPAQSAFGTVRGRRETNSHGRIRIAEAEEAKARYSHAFHRILTTIQHDRIYWFLSTFWLISLISLIFSRETGLGLYGLGKITQFLLIFAYIRENCETLFSVGFWPFSRLNANHSNHQQNSSINANNANKPNVSRETYSHAVFWLILATLWFQAGLGIWQFIEQESLGLKVLGEEFLRPALPGIAEFVSRETILIRAYGTLPHPNVLAGLLFVGMMVNLHLLYSTSPAPRLPLGAPSPGLGRGWRRGRTVVLGLSLLLLTTGLVVTFSRFAWAITGLAVLGWLVYIFWKRKRQTFLLVVSLLFISLFINLFLFGVPIRDRLFPEKGKVVASFMELDESSNYNSLQERRMFNKIALSMVKQNPLWGVGLKNFVVSMDEYSGERLLPFLHQPAHNIYLLIAAEIGLIGLLVFAVVLFYIFKNIMRPSSRSLISLRPTENQTSLPGKHPSDSILSYTLLVIFISLLLMGLFDHYLWTIQQGQLAFWILLGLMASREQ